MPLRQNRLTGIAVGAVAAGLLVVGAHYGHDVSERHKLRQKVEAMTGGNVARGERAFAGYGCSSCHSIPGVSGASGMVGPPLAGIASRAVIAGKLENKPDNLERWIIDPQAVSPGTAMPRLGVSPRSARDLAAFLYMQS